MYNGDDQARLAVIVDADTDLPLRGISHEYPQDSGRPPFGRDYDRLIHTPAFRRLQGKTQVVTPGQSDFFRTRLTHTIEVAQIARRLAYRLCQNSGESHAIEAADICEAAAIVHDFGHPPFGHIGEQALHSALRDVSAERFWQLDFERLGGYEGNAQSFRQAVWSFRRSEVEGRGLQLTRAVLDAFIKYPWSFADITPKLGKWNFYPSESWAFDWVRKGVSGIGKSFEAQVMDWSDDVAYTTHDLEDWWHAGYIPLTMLSQSKTSRSRLAKQTIASWRKTGRIRDPASDPSRDPSEGELTWTESQVTDTIESLFETGGAFEKFRQLGTEYDGSSEAKEAMRHLKRKLFKRFINESKAEGQLDRGRHQANLAINEAIRRENAILKELVWNYVIEHPRMATHQNGQRAVVSFLVKTYASLVLDDGMSSLDVLPRDRRERIRRLREHADQGASKYEILRLIADQVAGMTDSYAIMMHQRLSGQVSGHINEFI